VAGRRSTAEDGSGHAGQDLLLTTLAAHTRKKPLVDHGERYVGAMQPVLRVCHRVALPDLVASYHFGVLLVRGLDSARGGLADAHLRGGPDVDEQLVQRVAGGRGGDQPRNPVSFHGVSCCGACRLLDAMMGSKILLL
jgi:hypothetical protein